LENAQCLAIYLVFPLVFKEQFEVPDN